MKITGNAYIKVYADFNNKLGRFVIKNKIARSDYKLVAEFLKNSLQRALKSNNIVNVKGEFLKLLAGSGIGMCYIPFEKSGKEYTIKERVIIHRLINLCL